MTSAWEDRDSVLQSLPGTFAGTAPDLKGEVALVTGSGRGLGRGIAEALAKGGAAVAIHDRTEEAPARYGECGGLTDVVREIERRGVRATGVTGDISDEESVRRLVADAETSLGPISILVNCAGGDIGVNGSKPEPNNALEVPIEDVHAVINRNLIGTMLICRMVCPGMARRGRGAVINIGSVAGHYGGSPEVAYACAKAAVLHYTRCLAFEMRNVGVRINAVSPGPTMTARFLATRSTDAQMMQHDGPSLVRYATTEEIADAVAFLASSQSRFISGQVLRVDGGSGLYPG
ncbi:MAG TPA: SDR family oxidoreductase [Bryobacteraceae bacterium]|nr:SDR family oxidoreductase [Bryobacteraceae bacterium]